MPVDSQPIFTKDPKDFQEWNHDMKWKIQEFLLEYTL